MPSKKLCSQPAFEGNNLLSRVRISFDSHIFVVDSECSSWFSGKNAGRKIYLHKKHLWGWAQAGWSAWGNLPWEISLGKITTQGTLLVVKVLFRTEELQWELYVYIYTWNPKHRFINGWLSIGWFSPNLYLGNGWKSQFPSIKKCLLGVPGICYKFQQLHYRGILGLIQIDICHSYSRLGSLKHINILHRIKPYKAVD